MIKTGYLNKYQEYPEEEEKVLIMRNRGNDELAPSEELLKDYKHERINWAEYKERFLEEMECPESQARIRELAEESQDRDIRLICFEGPDKHCHRHILKRLIEEVQNEK